MEQRGKDGLNDLLPVIKYGFDEADDERHGNRQYGLPMNAPTRSDLSTMSVRPSVCLSVALAPVGKHVHTQCTLSLLAVLPAAAWWR